MSGRSVMKLFENTLKTKLCAYKDVGRQGRQEPRHVKLHDLKRAASYNLRVPKHPENIQYLMIF